MQLTVARTDPTNIIADGGVGIRVEAATLNFGFLSDPSLPLEERQSSDNEILITVADTTFQNNAIDIVMYGSRSNSGEPGGDNNMAIVKIDDDSVNTEVHDCFPEADFPTCNNEAKVKFE